MNLFTAILIDSLFVQSRFSELLVSKENIEAFVHEWAKFDQEGTSFIQMEDFPKLIKNLITNPKTQSLLAVHKTLAKDLND